VKITARQDPSISSARRAASPAARVIARPPSYDCPMTERAIVQGQS
jgi:hypothetical protein